jgi:hypothetical protein
MFVKLWRDILTKKKNDIVVFMVFYMCVHCVCGPRLRHKILKSSEVIFHKGVFFIFFVSVNFFVTELSLPCICVRVYVKRAMQGTVSLPSTVMTVVNEVNPDFLKRFVN